MQDEYKFHIEEDFDVGEVDLGGGVLRGLVLIGVGCGHRRALHFGVMLGNRLVVGAEQIAHLVDCVLEHVGCFDVQQAKVESQYGVVAALLQRVEGGGEVVQLLVAVFFAVTNHDVGRCGGRTFA